MTEPTTIDLDRLLKLRLVVARYGEMDGAGWWNTNGVLGKKGGLLMSRGFPKTRRFAQARLVFDSLEGTNGDLLAMLRDRGLVDSQQESEVGRMRRSAEG